MEQLDIFGIMYDKYTFKDINLIELFAGYGSQALALKYLGVKFKHHKIVEWATKSIQAYNEMHFQDNTDYSKEMTDIDVLEFLVDKGISMDYNQPMTREQIKRKGVEWQRKVYNDIIATHNLVDISRVHASDLEMRGGQDYIMTYSFPCTDLSLAGLRKGMERDSGTRSGLLWQVERILLECKETGIMPQVLLMENVPEVCGENNKESFKDWCIQLTKLGYHNTMAILNAKDFGIPQNRRRCFMLSIYGEYAYSMPSEMKLEYKLKDLLENNVDEKYYLNGKQIEEISKWNAYEKPLERMEQTEKSVICPTITTRTGEYTSSIILIKNVTKDDYKGTYNYGKSDNFIQWHEEGHFDLECRAWFEDGIAPTTTTPKQKILQNDLRIRKLTPRECFRLMGVKDMDSNKINQSDASKYHLAGDSIVTTCLMAIFGELLGLDYKSKIEELVENIKQK